MASPKDPVFVSRELAEGSRDLLNAHRRGSLTPPTHVGLPPSTGGAMPPIRGILLEDLKDDLTADAAVTVLVKDTTIQRVIVLGVFPTGGTFTLSFNGKTTPPLKWNISAADLQAALQKLETIGPNNATVTLGPGSYSNVDTTPFTVKTENPGLWLVTFTGQFDGKTDTPLMTIDGSALTGGFSATVIATTTWADTGKVLTFRALIPVDKNNTPMRAGAVAVAIHFPGQCYGVIAVEPRIWGSAY